MPASRLPWLVFLCTVLPRFGALYYFGLPGPTYYHDLADGLLLGGTFAYFSMPTTYMEPLYPLFLAGARLITGDTPVLVLAIQIMVAGAGGVLLFHLTHHVTGSPRTGLIAAALYAFCPYLVRQAATYLAMTLIITLLLAATHAFKRIAGPRRAMVTGAWFGLVLLTRAALLPAVLGGIALLWFRRQRRGAAACALATALVVGPWVVRCVRLDGSLLPTRVGENLYVSTGPLADSVVPRYDVDLLVTLAQAQVEPLLRENHAGTQYDLDKTFMELALSRAIDEPWRVLKLKARNLAYVFVPRLLPVHAKDARTVAVLRDGAVVIQHAVPRPALWEWSHRIAASLVMLAASVGVFLRRRRLWREAFLACVGLSVILVQSIFFPTTRLLAPMLFVLMFYAACALDEEFRLLSSRWPSHRHALRLHS